MKEESLIMAVFIIHLCISKACPWERWTLDLALTLCCKWALKFLRLRTFPEPMTRWGNFYNRSPWSIHLVDGWDRARSPRTPCEGEAGIKCLHFIFSHCFLHARFHIIGPIHPGLLLPPGHGNPSWNLVGSVPLPSFNTNDTDYLYMHTNSPLLSWIRPYFEHSIFKCPYIYIWYIFRF